MPAAEKRCPACGGSARLDAARCPHCGRVFGQLAPHPAPHDVSVAAMMSIFFPGGGELYNGQGGKAITMAALFLVVIVTALVLRLWWVGLAAPLLWALSIADASIIAGRLVRGEPVSAWKWF